MAISQHLWILPKTFLTIRSYDVTTSNGKAIYMMSILVLSSARLKRVTTSYEGVVMFSGVSIIWNVGSYTYVLLESIPCFGEILVINVVICRHLFLWRFLDVGPYFILETKTGKGNDDNRYFHTYDSDYKEIELAKQNNNRV